MRVSSVVSKVTLRMRLICAVVWLATLSLAGCGAGRVGDAIQLPERPVEAVEADADSLAVSLARLGATAKPFELMVTEQQVTAYLRKNVQDWPVEAISVWIEPDGIYVMASVNSHRQTVAALLTVQAADELPQLGVSAASLNEKRLPRWLLDSLEKVVNDALTDMQLSWSIDQIELLTGQAIITGEID